jgi:hypothetical protein
MTSTRAIAVTPSFRTDLRLVVLAQWVRAGLALMRGTATTGRGLIGGAVALWRVAQAIRLAMVLAQRLGEIRLATGSGRSCSGPDVDPAEPRDDRPTNADALRQALAELAATISDALARTPQLRPGSSAVAAARVAPPPGVPHPRVHRTRPRGLRPHRPPGPRPPRGRRTCPPPVCHPPLTPIAAAATGRSRLG